jgi:chromosome partitioning protein
MKTLVLPNMKGGVGKTALATLLARYLAWRGLRVLAIDLDHQGNMTRPIRLSGKAAVSSVTADRLLTDDGAAVEDAPFVLVPSGPDLLRLERQPDKHNSFASRLRSFLQRANDCFDVCVIDVNPNPDIRAVSALVSANYALAPIQLNQESIDGIVGLLGHERVGIERIKSRINPGLQLLGILPMMVEPTPFQRRGMQSIVSTPHYLSRLLAMVDDPKGGQDYARIPKRTVVAESQACGQALWEMRNKTAAREAWGEIQPVLDRVCQRMEVLR